MYGFLQVAKNVLASAESVSAALIFNGLLSFVETKSQAAFACNESVSPANVNIEINRVDLSALLPNMFSPNLNFTMYATSYLPVQFNYASAARAFANLTNIFLLG